MAFRRFAWQMTLPTADNGLSGQELITRQITELKTQNDIINLPNGIYFVWLTKAGTVHVGKFIMQ